MRYALLLLLSLTLSSIAAIAADAPYHNLPADAAKRFIDFESESAAIQKAADADIKAARDRSVQDLETMQEAYTKAGKLDEALTIRERIRDLRGRTDKPKNLLLNGSFEDGPKGSQLNIAPGSNDLPGWLVIRGTVDLSDGIWQAADGTRCIDLNGSPGIGGIQQTIRTKKGDKYRVTFSLAGDPAGNVPMKTMEVSAAGQKKAFSFNTKGKSPQNMGWTTQSWDFKADGEETTIAFYSTMTTDDQHGPAIDKISVVVIEQ